MRIVEGYIARQIARTTGIVLLIITSALVLERTLRLIRDVDPAHLPLGLAASMLACKVPEILGIALPPAFFAGILLTFQRLVRDRELDVLYATGTGLRRMMRPLLLLTVAATGVAMLVFWLLLPLGRYEYSALTQLAYRHAFAAPFKMGTFIEFGGKVLFVAPQKDRPSQPGQIFLYERDPQGYRRVTTAIAERFEAAPERARLFISVRHGQRVTLPNGNGRSTLLSFEHGRQMIYSIGDRATVTRGADTAELTLPELLSATGMGTPERQATIASHLNDRIARVLLMLLIPLTAVPLAMAFPPARQWIAIAAGVLLVLGIDQALIFGEAMASRGRAPPILAIWGPMAVFAVIVAALFAVVAAKIPRGRL